MRTMELVKLRDHSGIVVMELGGMVSVTNTGLIWGQIKELVEDVSTRRMIVDLSGVIRLDSSGLGLLVKIAKAFRGRNGRLCLAGISGSVAEVLELTRLDGFFRVFCSVDEAVESLQSSAHDACIRSGENGRGEHLDAGALAGDFRELLRTMNPMVSDEEIARLVASIRQLESSEMMMTLLVDAYDKDLLAKADEIATKRLSVIREVAIGLNHEINNPLTVILATSELLERRLSGRVETSILHRLRSIQSQCDRIKEIVAKVSAIVKPVSSEYYCGMKMIDVHKSG